MKDKCIDCGKKTLHDREEHIDFRIGYIEGAGQLCLNCYDEIYKKNFVKENIKKTKENGESK